jgi:hypothetical protein
MVGTYLVNIESHAVAMIAATWAVIIVCYVIALYADKWCRRRRERKYSTPPCHVTFPPKQVK